MRKIREITSAGGNVIHIDALLKRYGVRAESLIEDLLREDIKPEHFNHRSIETRLLLEETLRRGLKPPLNY